MTTRTDIQAPDEYVLNLTPKTGSGVDLSLVDPDGVHVLIVKDPHGNLHEWAATIATQSANALQLRHLMTLGEMGIAGTYSIKAKLAMIGGGFKFSDPLEEPVKGAFEV